MRIFYGDRRPNEDLRAFLTYLETRFACHTNYTEEEKSESLACHLGAGSIAERWYDKLEISTPEITNSWATLHKHFCVKWLGASPNILLNIPENEPLAVSTATTTPREQVTLEHDDEPRHSLPPTTNSQPTDYAPVTPKHDPNAFKSTTATITNEMTPKAAKSRHATSTTKTTSTPTSKVQTPPPSSPAYSYLCLVTCQPSARAHETRGALSATATIATAVPSHHAAPRLPTPPNEPPGTASATPTGVFTHHIHHHPVSTHSQTLRRSTSSKRSTIRRGLPP